MYWLLLIVSDTRPVVMKVMSPPYLFLCLTGLHISDIQTLLFWHLQCPTLYK
jgi:hypothetical protein